MKKLLVNKSDIVQANLNKEVVILNFKNQSLHVLNDSGAKIFKMLKKPMTQKKIINSFIYKNKEAKLKAKKNIKEYLKGLVKKSLIKKIG